MPTKGTSSDDRIDVGGDGTEDSNRWYSSPESNTPSPTCRMTWRVPGWAELARDMDRWRIRGKKSLSSLLATTALSWVKLTIDTAEGGPMTRQWMALTLPFSSTLASEKERKLHPNLCQTNLCANQCQKIGTEDRYTDTARGRGKGSLHKGWIMIRLEPNKNGGVEWYDVLFINLDKNEDAHESEWQKFCSHSGLIDLTWSHRMDGTCTSVRYMNCWRDLSKNALAALGRYWDISSARGSTC